MVAAGVPRSITPGARPLETGGGIKAALDIIGDEAFAVVSSDVYMDMNYEDLPRNLVSGSLGCLVMVSNPPHHPRGDFSLNGDRLEFEGNRMTYSGVSVLNPEFSRDRRRCVSPSIGA